VDLRPVAEHRRGHDAVNNGNMHVPGCGRHWPACGGHRIRGPRPTAPLRRVRECGPGLVIPR